MEQPAERLPVLAARAVLAASVVLALVELGRVQITNPASDFLVALAVTVVVLPLHLRHLRFGLRGERPPRPGPTLAAMAVAHAVALVVIGPIWAFSLAALATSALIVLRPPWSLLALAACAAAPVGAVALDAGEGWPGSETAYLVISVLFRSVLQFALVWLVAATRQLTITRASATRAAGEAERARLENEIRASLERRTATLGAAARNARAALAGPGVAAPLLALDRVLDLSREALADLRGIVAEARRPAPREAEDALARAARAARSPIGRALAQGHAWQATVAVHVVVLGFLVATHTGWLFEDPILAPDHGGRALALAMVVVAVALFSCLTFDTARGRRPRYGPPIWSVIVVLYAVGLETAGPGWNSLGWLVGAGALMVLPGRSRWVVAGVTTAFLMGWNTHLVGELAPDMPTTDVVWDACYTLALDLLAIFGLYASARLAPVVATLGAIRDGLAEQAAHTERRRLSSDLHDVLGQSLTAISLKGDLARRLVKRDRGAAIAELDALLLLVDDQDCELDAVTRGEREVAFDAEVANAVRLLESAGIAVSTTLGSGDLPADASSLLGWAVREGATNVLRHAAAANWCAIRLERGHGDIRLVVLNDGVRAAHRDGTGLAALSDRFAESGGVASGTALPGGRFRLEAGLPVTEQVPA